ncbi:MAG: hypothetical protein H7Y88_03075 [Phycisphaerales bacterium]|nr:hypothetical protein [Phycisphaerales bacterium]
MQRLRTRRGVQVAWAIACAGTGAIMLGLARIEPPAQVSRVVEQREIADRLTMPFVQWAGHETKCKRIGFVLVTDAAAWRSLWSEHVGRDDLEGAMGRNEIPSVDFGQCEVLAYFRGPSINRDGESAESIGIDGERVRVRFVGDTFQTAGPDGGAQRTTSFGMWVVARSGKPITVEEGYHGLKNEPPKWKTVWRSDAE